MPGSEAFKPRETMRTKRNHSTLPKASAQLLLSIALSSSPFLALTASGSISPVQHSQIVLEGLSAALYVGLSDGSIA
jgi:hypothetical protein